MALTSVPTEGLKTMLRELHHGRLTCPLTPAGVVCLGLQDHLPAIMSVMRSLDAAALRSVLVAVLAERESQGSLRPGT